MRTRHSHPDVAASAGIREKNEVITLMSAGMPTLESGPMHRFLVESPEVLGPRYLDDLSAVPALASPGLAEPMVPLRPCLDRARLRVCMLAPCPFPANHGTSGSIREMAEALVERGHEVDIVTYHVGELIPVNGPRVHRIPSLTAESAIVAGPTARKPLYDLQMVFKALQVIRTYRADVIHAHGHEGAMIAGLCRYVTGLPIVYNQHMTMIDELASFHFVRPRWLAKPLARILDTVVLRIADRIIPNSTNMERFLRSQGVSARTEAVIYKGIDVNWKSTGDPALLRQRYRLGADPVILYAGMMETFQRLDLLLEAMTQVVRVQPNAKLLVVRTIHSDRLLALFQERVAACGLAQQVIVTEPQPLPAVYDHLALCDVAVVSRPKCSGFPIKVLNYMVARKACVLFASSASGLTHGDNAFLVSSDTGAALGDGILQVLQDDELRQQLARNGHWYVRSHRDRRVTARQICDVYFRALKQSGRPLPQARAQ